MSQITTHVLDTSSGKPAEGIHIKLFFQNKEIWEKLADGITNKDGRIGDLLKDEIKLEKGIYKMEFETGSYFKEKNLKIFYPSVNIIFEIDSNEHYHIPLLLSPFGYSTYRGS